MSAASLKVLIVDDEAPARRHLERLLARRPELGVVGTARSAREARQLAAARRPDAALVDIELPGGSGLELARDLEASGIAVVLVTAYSRHAVAAFDVDAADFLLKPFDEDRLSRALDRLRRKLARPAPGEPTLERLVVSTRGRFRLLDPKTIDWIEADGKGTVVHAGQDTFACRRTLGVLEQRLAAHGFARIHRSALVRIGAVRELWPAFHGDWILALHGGAELVLSRRFRDRLRSLLG